jgi:hypothetical protein
MNRRLLLTLLVSVTLAACAPSISPNPISRDVRNSLTFGTIEVTTTGTAFESTRATDYSSRLSADLKTILTREFSDRMAAGGATMVVDLARFNLAGATTTAFGRDQSTLQGSVRILTPDGTLLGTYAIQSISGDAAQTTTGALIGAAVNSADGFYRDMLTGFARDTREQVLGRDLPGQRLIRRATSG